MNSISDGFNIDWPLPNAKKCFHRFLSIVDTQINAFMHMTKQKFSAIFIIAIDNFHHRFSKICQLKKKLLFDFFKFTTRNFILIRRNIERKRKKLLFCTKLRSKKSINKGNVIMKSSHFKNFFSSQSKFFIPFPLLHHIGTFFIFFSKPSFIPSLFNIAKKLDAKLIRIEFPGC